MQRKDGYYWIKVVPCATWELADWMETRGCFVTCHLGLNLREESVYKVWPERALPPNEQK